MVGEKRLKLYSLQTFKLLNGKESVDHEICLNHSRPRGDWG